ncbi:MAG TPA: NAD(P)-dependent oxidoreductase [Casimicrobiaceae bacterium]|nr:NAD(P)-dependent oxidoreductase [Casimicrobiaceae bacterium]
MNSSNERAPVGFIGLGIMGASMAGHVLRGGHPLHVYNRSPARAEPLLAAGAQWHDSPGAVAAAADVVITMVGTPDDVEAIYLGPDGIVARARAGATLIDMTTSSPALAEKIAAAAAARGVHALDAPVSGGDVGAREAKLSIMVGGDEEAFRRAQPILALMGTKIVRQGGPGAGQHTKLCNQIVIASTMLGVCEGLAYAQRSGLDAPTVLESIGGGAAGSFLLNNLGPRILRGDFAPGFMIDHLVKDLRIAHGEGERLALDLPGLTLALRQYEALAESGEGRSGTQALYKRYAR